MGENYAYFCKRQRAWGTETGVDWDESHPWGGDGREQSLEDGGRESDQFLLCLPGLEWEQLWSVGWMHASRRWRARDWEW